ncbi:MAG: saccharopine dehydrogenase C-terminal domain-containing protein [Acidobacteriota bacterium]
MKKVAVLGGGRVGAAMARDMVASGFDVTVHDVSRHALARLSDACGTVESDLSDPSIVRDIATSTDLVIGAVPSRLGFSVLRAVVSTGTPVVDISFFTEDPFELDTLAREHGSIAIVDAGIAPGMSNVLFGRCRAELTKLDVFRCYVGGLPVERTWPWEYKAPFAPADVIEEYTRPTRMIRSGSVVTVPALTEPERIEFASVGTLEAFNTDGLRSLLRFTDVSEMVEKTCRYPGHREWVEILRETGFFSEQAIELDGQSVVPRQLTEKLIFSAWQLEEEDEDVLCFRAVAEGETVGGDTTRITFDLVDRYDRATRTTAMARCTGYAATSMARLIAAGHWRKTGIMAPESVGEESACYEFLMADLAARGIEFVRQDGDE